MRSQIRSGGAGIPRTTLSDGREGGLAVVEFASETAVLNDQNYFTSWIERAAPTNKAIVQLRNPSVDKNYIVSGIYIVSQNANDEFRIRYNAGTKQGATTAGILNTYLGGAASTAEVSTGEVTTQPGIFAYNILPQVIFGEPFNILDTSGMVIAPGNDIIILNNTGTNNLSVGFSWKEVNL